MSSELALHLALEIHGEEGKQTGFDIFKSDFVLRIFVFHEESCMVPLLCNNHYELWNLRFYFALLKFEFASLNKIKNLLVIWQMYSIQQRNEGAQTLIIC